MNRTFATFLTLIATLALAISPLRADAQQLGFSNDDQITGCVKPNGRIYAVPNARRDDCAESDRAVAFLPIFLGNAILAGYNLQIVNGSGTNVKNGLGNVIVGYNGDPNEVDGNTHERPRSDRSGSHNLIVGTGHSYGGVGSIVTGYYNRADGDGSCVCGGAYNSASGLTSAIIGGSDNDATGDVSTVSGGIDNNANADESTIDGSEGDGQTTP